RPPRASSVEEWEERKKELRRQVLDCLGLWPLPERVPLKVRVSAERQGEGYLLQRVYWQVYPDVEASGWLYVPNNINGRAPAVLCPHGHWDTGARHRVVQARCIGLAQRGYVVLAVDSVHLDDYRVGVNPVGLMTWNNIRGVDLLVSRADVDPERIGCTGASGGGQQTMYLMAVEPRITVAAPTVMMSYFTRIVAINVAHCYCNHVPAIMRYTDEPEMCAAFAPKPALYMCDTRDWTQWFPHEGFPEISGIYRLYGADNRVECHQWDVGHDYTRAMRETMYGFFARWLKGAPAANNTDEGELHTVDPAELAKMGPSKPRGEDLPAISAEYLSRRAVAPTNWHEEKAALVAERVRPALADLLGEPIAGAMPVAVEVRGEETAEGLRWRRLVFEGERGVQVPGIVVEPEVASGPLRGVVIAAPGGKKEVLKAYRQQVERLARKGWAVLCPDFRFTGELTGNTSVWMLHGILWGRPVGAMAARDLRAAAHALASLPEVGAGSVALVAMGKTGIAGLVAAALDAGEKIGAFACSDLGPTFRQAQPRFPKGDTYDILRRRYRPAELAADVDRVLPNILKVGDLPELVACLTATRALVGGVGDLAPYDGLGGSALLLEAQPTSMHDLVRWLTEE
ncbi:MAG: acetylxylan esterase, partial [Armatimonadetes bacterium]|nr:acetylxylan esterase [Armatimonadota bacterium]